MNDERDEHAPLSMPEGTKVEFLGPDIALLTIPLPPAQLPACLTEAERDVALRVYAGRRTSRSRRREA